MRKSFRWGLMVLLALITVGVSLNVQAADQKEHVDVLATGTFNAAFTAGNFTCVGTHPGPVTAQYIDMIPVGDGSFMGFGKHHFTTPNGDTILTYDSIKVRIDPRHPTIGISDSRLYIVGGTGRYAHATGLLVSSGSGDLTTGNAQIRLQGKILLND